MTLPGQTAAAPSRTDLARLTSSLISPYGIAPYLQIGESPRGLNRYSLAMAAGGMGDRKVSASGRSLDDRDHARLLAVAEAAERYAASQFPERDGVLSSADNLDGPRLDRLPACSDSEYAQPGCPVVPFDQTAPIRWIRGTDLHTGEASWIPAVLASYHGQAMPAERFCYRISTGHAVHSDPDAALLGAVLEVIERDAISLTWLQMLSLPEAGRIGESGALGYLLDWNRHHFIQTRIFDATTDLGIPTAYVVQVAPYDARIRSVVGCGTGRPLEQAAERAMTELVSLRSMLRDHDVPASAGECRSVEDGAVYMGVPERAHAFGFLLNPPGARGPVQPRLTLPAEPAEALRVVLGALARCGMQAVAVDRTTRELAAAGLVSTYVCIPGLQPMSLDPRVQFRAHPRLYQAPKQMGYVVREEGELNPWPQPFA